MAIESGSLINPSSSADPATDQSSMKALRNRFD